jgi:hypothetical protein
MRLPEWFPQVPRPWNPAFRSVWDAMTPAEKPWSCFVDALVVALCLGLMVYGASA